MAQFFQIHPQNPQLKLIRSAVEIIRNGGVVVYPTDSCYAIGCHIGDKNAMERIRAIRQVDEKFQFTLICRDLSEIATYARVDNVQYRLLKSNTPGSYTFILKATKEVPKRLLNPRKSTIGVRIPDHPVALALLAELNEPLLSASMILPGDDQPLNDPLEIRELLQSQVDLVLDGGHCDGERTTVIDLSEDVPQLVRVGKGSVENFGLTP